MKRILATLAAIIALCAFVPYALALTKEFQVNTWSGGSLTTDLVSYWNMQGNSNDYYGSNNGTDSNMLYGSSYGKVNEGAAFSSASSSKVYLGTPASLIISPSISIAAWIKMASGSAQTATIVSQMSGPSGGHLAYEMSVNDICGTGGGAGSLCMRVEYGNGEFQDIGTVSGLVNNGNWNFVVAIYNAGAQSLYVNDVEEASRSLGSSIYYEDDTSGASIGYAHENTDENFFTGDIDEVGIWSKALSANEILDLYNGGAGQTMCTVGGSPACSGGAKHKIIVVSFVAKPEHPLA